VQIIPHITEEIKKRIRQESRDGGCEICLIEVGGTVGDIESMPFLEAMRQLRYEESGNIFFVHVTLGSIDHGWRAEDQAHTAQRQGDARAWAAA